jgi:signal transduction histidine kinase
MVNDTNNILKNNNLTSVEPYCRENETICFWTACIKNPDVKEFSENVIRITGYSNDEINNIPGGFYSLIHSEDLTHIKKLHNDFYKNPDSDTFCASYRIIEKDQNVVWIKEEIRTSKNNNKEIDFYHGFILNIGEFKRVEAFMLKQNDILLKLNNSKDKFISILSHDLRAPFTSILGFTEILMNEPNLGENEKIEYLNYIHESSQNQLQLINYLLDWSRLQTGRIKIEPVRLHVQTLVCNCVSSLTGNAIRKNIEIKMNVMDNLFIQADERLISQVITNLISNAIKFSPELKTVQVKAQIFNDEKIEFIIKDEGIGIADSFKEKLFKVEKMFSTEGTKGEKGTGLGLSLVKEIVEKHKGDIWFYTEIGQGSEFHFTVPSAQNVILLVVDTLEERNILKKFIKENFPEFKVLVTDNAFEAITIISSKIPSVIITKHDIPYMDGIQLLKTVRKGEKGHKVPVIAIIDELTDETKKLYQEYGLSAFLQKPFDENKFNQKLYSVLN